MKSMRYILIVVIVLFEAAAISSEIPEGRLGYPLGTYLEIEGIRATKGKVGANTLQVQRIQEKELAEPIGLWIDNVESLPTDTKIILRGYESGKMIGLPDEVARKEKLPIPQAAWQFYRFFIVTSVVAPDDMELKK